MVCLLSMVALIASASGHQLAPAASLLAAPVAAAETRSDTQSLAAVATRTTADLVQAGLADPGQATADGPPFTFALDATVIGTPARSGG